MLSRKLVSNEFATLHFVFADRRATARTTTFVEPCSIQTKKKDNSAVYVDLVKSLNGIRSASLDWLEFAQSIVGEPMKVKASAADPCVFSGEGLLTIIYVDDILVISKDSSVGKRVQDLLDEHVPTKMTGILEPHKVGR